MIILFPTTFPKGPKIIVSFLFLVSLWCSCWCWCLRSQHAYWAIQVKIYPFYSFYLFINSSSFQLCGSDEDSREQEQGDGRREGQLQRVDWGAGTSAASVRRQWRGLVHCDVLAAQQRTLHCQRAVEQAAHSGLAVHPDLLIGRNDCLLACCWRRRRREERRQQKRREKRKEKKVLGLFAFGF